MREIEVFYYSYSRKALLSTLTKLQKILTAVKNEPILTVSDSEGFAEEGVYINLYYKKELLAFEINYKASQQAGLKISYLLRNVAKIVEKEK